MYKEEYERWLAADLEDADLKPELSKINGNDEEIKERSRRVDDKLEHREYLPGDRRSRPDRGRRGVQHHRQLQLIQDLKDLFEAGIPEVHSLIVAAETDSVNSRKGSCAAELSGRFIDIGQREQRRKAEAVRVLPGDI